MTNLRSIFILTGAGISAESGIPTFRDSNGLWHEHDVSEVASPSGFQDSPDLVFQFYKERREGLLGVTPNAAHAAIAELQEKFSGEVMLVTQNIDGLHGISALEMHGSLSNYLCTSCHHRSPIESSLDSYTICGACGANTCRPDVVWFTEMPRHLDEIDAMLSRCDIFVSIGTSGQVSPASDFVEYAWKAGCRNTVEINPKPTWNRRFIKNITKVASIGVPEFVEEVLKRDAGA